MMARLIDADAIIDFIDMDSTWDPLETCFSEKAVVDMLESAPPWMPWKWCGVRIVNIITGSKNLVMERACITANYLI